MKAGAARTQNTMVVKGAQQVKQAEQAVIPARVEARQADAKVAQARQTQETQVKQTKAREVCEQAEVAQEEATEAATFQHPDLEMPATLGNTKEFADVRTTAMANTGTKSADQVDMAKEPEPVVKPDSAEQAALMAAIKGGAGANPDLIAKVYVNAAGMEGGGASSRALSRSN